MKILIITNHSYMLYRFRKELIQELMKEHEVLISMPFVGHEEDFEDMGLRCINTAVDRRGLDLRTDFKLLRTYRRLLEEEQPDMVITYSIKPNIYGGIACSRLGISFCANVQGLGTAFQKKGLVQLVSLLYKTALRKAKTVFFENKGSAKEFLNRKIIPQHKVTVLPGAGINLKEYPLMSYPDNDIFHFLYLGRIMKEKGIDELFAAMKKIRSQKGNEIVLDIVGFFEDDCDYEAEIKKLVEDGIVVFHGFQEEPRPYYVVADCVVLPSHHEGMSNVLLEAASLGRPVITSDIHGCKEAVEHGKTGLLCSVKDSDSLYDQMLRMVNIPVEERRAMGEAAHLKMQQEFEKNFVVQETVQAIFD